MSSCDVGRPSFFPCLGHAGPWPQRFEAAPESGVVGSAGATLWRQSWGQFKKADHQTSSFSDGWFDTFLMFDFWIFGDIKIGKHGLNNGCPGKRYLYMYIWECGLDRGLKSRNLTSQLPNFPVSGDARYHLMLDSVGRWFFHDTPYLKTSRY